MVPFFSLASSLGEASGVQRARKDGASLFSAYETAAPFEDISHPSPGCPYPALSPKCFLRKKSWFLSTRAECFFVPTPSHRYLNMYIHFVILPPSAFFVVVATDLFDTYQFFFLHPHHTTPDQPTISIASTSSPSSLCSLPILFCSH